MKLRLLKTGEFSGDLEEQASRLSSAFGLEAAIAPSYQPPAAYLRENGLYWALPVLKDLARLYPEDLVLGMGALPIYQAGLGEILGERLEKGNAALVSLAALGPDAGADNERCYKLAARQLWSRFCGENCPRCLNAPLERPGDLDLLPAEFCPECRAKLEAADFKLAPGKFPPGKLKFVYHPGLYADLAGHIFPMEKYEALYRRLRQEGAGEDEFLAPREAGREELERVHTPEYLDDWFSLRPSPRISSSELPLSAEIVRAFGLHAGGSILGARTALSEGAAFLLGGGFHHAFPDHAEGFCYLNDIALALKILLREGSIRKAAVIDCDVHQGNGTAVIFRDEPGVFTFSIHQENLYPPKRQSTLDIGLENRAGDGEYLSRLRKSLPAILEFFSPDLVIYVAGADPYEKDRIGGLGLTMEGLRQRDELVLGGCFQKRVPVLTVLAGGYAAEFSDTVGIHLHTALSARQLWG